MASNILLMWVILASAITSSASIFCTGECKESGRRCRDSYSYQYCMNMTDYAVGTIAAKKCPEGTICSDQGFFPCKVSTVPSDPPPVTVPSCSGPDKFAANYCNEYYECLPVLWYFRLVTQTCPSGQNFDPSLKQCSDLYVCPGSSAESPDVPKCDGPGRLPGPTNNQYYECELIWFQWQAQLKICPNGQHFEVINLQCVFIPNPVTTDKSTQVVPSSTTPTVVKPSQCNGAGRYPGPATNQYYECVLIWFQWQPELKTCPNNQIFDKASTQCVTTATLDANLESDNGTNVLKRILKMISKG